MTVFILTKTYPPIHKGGGPSIKEAQVNFLKKKLDENIKVISLTDNVYNEKYTDNILFYYGKNRRYETLKQRLGIQEDYLDSWSEKIVNYLEKHVERKDTVISLSGGDLATIKIAAIIGRSKECKTIAYLHDPIDFSNPGGHKQDNKPHIKRKKIINKYLKNIQNIVVTNKIYKNELISSFKINESRIDVIPFGYRGNIEYSSNCYNYRKKLHLVYAGTNHYAQQLEKPLSKFRKYASNKDIEISLFGNKTQFKNAIFSDLTVHEFVPHNKLKHYLHQENIVILAALTPTFYKYCIPSKLYDSVKFGIPILLFSPCGAASDLVVNNFIGIHMKNEDIDRKSVQEALGKFADRYGMMKRNLMNLSKKLNFTTNQQKLAQLISAK